MDPKITNRAKWILGTLFLALTIITFASFHQAIASGEFERVILNPLKQLAEELAKSDKYTPIPTPTPFSSFDFKTNFEININESTRKITPTPQTIKYTTPVAPCIRKNIREGEFASNKCYSQQDYEDLEYYLGRYQDAQFDLRSAEGFEKINCGAAQTFEEKKADCEESQKDKAQALADIEKYKGIIHGIIAKGK